MTGPQYREPREPAPPMPRLVLWAMGGGAALCLALAVLTGWPVSK
jgi:hypothetical protein